jgi:hypothetical protein
MRPIMWRGRPRPRNANSTTGRKRFYHCPVLALAVMLTGLTPWAAAQRPANAIAPRPATPRFNSPAGNFAFRQTAFPSRFHPSLPYTSLPFPFFGDFFNPDDIYSTGYPVASQPPVILLQAARAMAGSADFMDRLDMGQPGNHRAEPLMIELQNGRYVRVEDTAADSDAQPLTLPAGNPQSAKQARRNSTTRLAESNPAAASSAHNLPPALLVFRDGHSEEVHDYAIADGILYARGDYYTDGYWNKKIELSALNIAQTVQANNTRNVKFVLPSSPNEVITRP